MMDKVAAAGIPKRDKNYSVAVGAHQVRGPSAPLRLAEKSVDFALRFEFSEEVVRRGQDATQGCRVPEDDGAVDFRELAEDAGYAGVEDVLQIRDGTPVRRPGADRAGLEEPLDSAKVVEKELEPADQRPGPIPNLLVDRGVSDHPIRHGFRHFDAWIGTALGIQGALDAKDVPPAEDVASEAGLAGDRGQEEDAQPR